MTNNRPPSRTALNLSEDAVLDTSKMMYWKETQGIVKQLEEDFGARVIVLYVGSAFSLSSEEVGALYSHLQAMGSQERLVVVIHGTGGSPIAAYRAVKLLRDFTDHLIIIAPEIAASAMTMLSIGADELYTGPMSQFSPIDTSIARHPLAPLDKRGNPVTVEITQVQKYLELVQADHYPEGDDFAKTPYSILSDKVHPIFLGTVQRSLTLSRLLLKDIAAMHIDSAEEVQRIATYLNDDFPSHSYPIFGKDLARLGVNVKDLKSEQSALCFRGFSLFADFCKPYIKNDGERRQRISRPAVIESTELRSFYRNYVEERLVDKTWVNHSETHRYEHSTVVNNDKGFHEVRVLKAKQFQQWLAGEDVDLKD